MSYQSVTTVALPASSFVCLGDQALGMSEVWKILCWSSCQIYNEHYMITKKISSYEFGSHHLTRNCAHCSLTYHCSRAFSQAASYA